MRPKREIEVERECRIDTFSGGPRSLVACRVTHLPTGKTATATANGHYSARIQAIKMLLWQLDER